MKNYKIAKFCFSAMFKLLIILPRSKLRKLRRQTMRIERRPIHHSKGDSTGVGGIASHLSFWQSIQFRSPYRVHSTAAIIYRIPEERFQ